MALATEALNVLSGGLFIVGLVVAARFVLKNLRV